MWGERWLATMQRGRAMTIRWVVWTALAVDILLTVGFWLPTAPLNSRWRAITNEVQGDVREQIDWSDLVQEVARIRWAGRSSGRTFGTTAKNFLRPRCDWPATIDHQPCRDLEAAYRRTCPSFQFRPCPFA